MTQMVLIGLDVAKHVFQLHAVAADGSVVFRRQVRRPQLTTLLMSIPSCRIAMEACGTAHYWGRQLEELGHDVLLIPPDYVGPFVKRQKNDAADAEAIAEAAQRPDMRFVRVKSEASQARVLSFAHEIWWCARRPSFSMRYEAIWRNLVTSSRRVQPLLRRCWRSSRMMVICRPQLKASCVRCGSISHRVKLS